MVIGDIAIRLRNVTPFNVNGENRSGIGGSLFIDYEPQDALLCFILHAAQRSIRLAVIDLSAIGNMQAVTDHVR